MKFSTAYKEHSPEIIALFKATFTTSEGTAEGAQIGQLVSGMLETVSAKDISVFSALADDEVVGSAVFTRMRYPQDTRRVFILSPMAVAPSWQGKGLGQKLLSFGLKELRQNGVNVALTYGDINFYSKVGFSQISEALAQPPLPLSYPHGWLGQPLSGSPLAPLKGPSRCVEPLANPALW